MMMVFIGFKPNEDQTITGHAFDITYKKPLLSVLAKSYNQLKFSALTDENG